ncbi:MAG: HDOD domain-containing protein [Thermoleophilaceae bacterium]|nr:HDOD domain-containing protein [Thermoleophilaceae bacterium]
MARNAKQEPAADAAVPTAELKPRREATSDETPPRIGAQGQRQQGHGHRLTAAFEALERFPALAESRDRVLHLVTNSSSDKATTDLVEAIERDVALVITVIRYANKATGGRRKVVTVREAVEVLSPGGVEAIVTRTKTFDFFERTAQWDSTPDRFRLHAIATQQAAERIAREINWDGDVDALLVTALLHDIGKLVLTYAYEGYPQQVHGSARTPQERLLRERRELGVDHALVGGVLARRWGLPNSMAAAIERHHSDDEAGEAAIIRLADMLSHYAEGGDVSPDELLKASRNVRLTVRQLRSILYEVPNGGGNERKRPTSPSPLSPRESDVLRQLAEGNVYEEIAKNLHLSTSTVRTHLHNIYGKLGVKDRAQAVLNAAENGWL